jgi:hypothetical protein
MSDDKFEIGFTSPMVREWPRTGPPLKRRPIGFVHFGDPELEPGAYLEEYVKAIMDPEPDPEPF